MGGEVAGCRARLVQLEGALKAKSREVERLGRQLEQTAAAAVGGELHSSAVKSRCGGTRAFQSAVVAHTVPFALLSGPRRAQVSLCACHYYCASR